MLNTLLLERERATEIRDTAIGSICAVIPAYNEVRVINSVISGLVPFVDRVIVVDDGSSDGTAALARKSGADVLVHCFNLGQGAALQTGITYALRQGAELIVTFDADGQHTPEDIPLMVDTWKQSKADIVLGSRFLGGTEGMPWRRRLLLGAAVRFTRLTTGLQVSDTHNGLRLLTRRAASAINLRQNRMAHASEVFGEVARHKLSYIEAPVHIRYSEYSMRKGQTLFGAFDILIDLISGRFYR